MNLYLQREPSTEKATLGKLSLGEHFFCWTLEDVVREEKIYGKTAIPAGAYTLAVTPSNRFKKWMLELASVLHFSGIRIHSGNTAVDTDGCILVGAERGVDCVLQSRVAYANLFNQLCLPNGIDTNPQSPAYQQPRFVLREPTTITILNNPTE